VQNISWIRNGRNDFIIIQHPYFTTFYFAPLLRRIENG